ncbi:unnamed protein product [Mesocestoides corti]|uniref:Secreted protein n=1 Tax=Mesocestoides corti TaxID=53468 RepID=A0A0R3UNK2_MESCO|nr:unnamed protein product [Mesocestoides corti]
MLLLAIGQAQFVELTAGSHRHKSIGEKKHGCFPKSPEHSKYSNLNNVDWDLVHSYYVQQQMYLLAAATQSQFSGTTAGSDGCGPIPTRNDNECSQTGNIKITKPLPKPPKKSKWHKGVESEQKGSKSSAMKEFQQMVTRVFRLCTSRHQ